METAETLAERIEALSPNRRRAYAALRALRALGIDVADAYVALYRFASVTRADFECVLEYADARAEAWAAFLDCVDAAVEEATR